MIEMIQHVFQQSNITVFKLQRDHFDHPLFVLRIWDVQTRDTLQNQTPFG